MKKFNTALFAFVLLCLAACASSKPNNNRCSRFKNGTFSSFVEGANVFITVYRTDTLQVEVANGETDSLKLKVNWIDPCNYELVFLNTSYKGKRIMTKIIETSKDFYIYEAKMEDMEPLRDTMVLVRR